MAYSGVIHITLGGKEQRLWFNNFANDELRRYFATDGEVITDTDLIKRIGEKWKENHLLFLKNLVYAGILGDSFVTDDKVRVSKKQVGEWIATASPEEIYGVWRVFLEAQGHYLSSDAPKEGEEGKEQEEPKEETEDEKKSPESTN